MPQGSVLGPILFIIYTADLVSIVAEHGLSLHQYADDSQLYGSCRLTDTSSLSTVMTQCVNSNTSWMCSSPSPALDSIRVMVIVWRLRGNIIRTALCWIVWHNVHSLQHTYVSSSYRSNRLGLSHWDPYAVHRGSCLELYYCSMVEWFWWDSSLILTTNWFPSVL